MLTNIFIKTRTFLVHSGIVLFLAELVLPGFFIFFFGLGAWFTALVCLIGEPGVNNQLQIIIFAFISVLSLVTLRKIIQKRFFYSKGNESEKVEDEFTGKEALATYPVIGPDTIGKVEFKGTLES